MRIGGPWARRNAGRLASRATTARRWKPSLDSSSGMGGLSHEALMTNIELYGTQVIPRVRELLAADGR
jgi:hypothetical protein